MIDHTGYVFIAPNGQYLTRAAYFGHGNKYDWRMGLTHTLDAAELFPTDRIPTITPNFDWVVNILGADSVNNAINLLTPLPAISRQSIVIGKITHES